MWETQVWSLGWEDPLEKEMAAHSSILAWKIPWTEEHGRLQSMRSERVRHDWATSLYRHSKHFTNFTYVISSTSYLWSGDYFYLHFIDEETRMLGGKIICPGSHIQMTGGCDCKHLTPEPVSPSITMHFLLLTAERTKSKFYLTWSSLVAQMVKNLPAMQKIQVQSLGQENPLEKGKATHSSITAWRISWTEGIAGYSPWGSQRVRQVEWLTVNNIKL